MSTSSHSNGAVGKPTSGSHASLRGSLPQLAVNPDPGVWYSSDTLASSGKVRRPRDYLEHFMALITDLLFIIITIITNIAGVGTVGLLQGIQYTQSVSLYWQNSDLICF